MAPDTRPDEPTSTSSRRPTAFIAAVLGAIVLGVVVGLLVGRGIASSQAEDNVRAADRASEQEDVARDRRDLLDARLQVVDQQTKPLKEVVTTPPLLATAGTTEPKPGSEFTVDGGTYVVNGLQVVDSFESKDPKRPAKEQDGARWALVDVTYRNRTKEATYPACGTLQTIRLVLDDRTTAEEIRLDPPVHPDSYNVCGFPINPGKAGRWLAPISVPEGSKVAGIHVADVYVRSTASPYNVRSGKAAWLPLDEQLDVGSVGDDEVELTFGSEES